MWGSLHKKAKTKAREMRFEPFLGIPLLKADKAFLMALVERWSPITHTFHLPMGEIGLPLTDFYMMTHLPMGGDPPPYELAPSQEMVRRYLGPQPISYNRGFRGVLPSWFEKEYIWATDESQEVEIDYSVRAFLLYMFTLSVFSGKEIRFSSTFSPP